MRASAEHMGAFEYELSGVNEISAPQFDPHITTSIRIRKSVLFAFQKSMRPYTPSLDIQMSHNGPPSPPPRLLHACPHPNSAYLPPR